MALDVGLGGQILWGSVDINDQTGLFKDLDNIVWEDFLATNRHEKDYHRYMMSITSPNGFQKLGAAFVQLAHPTILWVVDWTAASWSSKPEIPDPDQVGDDWVLLNRHLDAGMIVVAADGVTPLYRISGTYVYGGKYPEVDGHCLLFFARPPWLKESIDRGFPKKQLRPDIIREL